MADTKALFLSCELGLRLQVCQLLKTAVKAVYPIMFGLHHHDYMITIYVMTIEISIIIWDSYNREREREGPERENDKREK